jgi:hypothetical protein
MKIADDARQHETPRVIGHFVGQEAQSPGLRERETRRTGKSWRTACGGLPSGDHGQPLTPLVFFQGVPIGPLTVAIVLVEVGGQNRIATERPTNTYRFKGGLELDGADRPGTAPGIAAEGLLGSVARPPAPLPEP